MRGMGGIKLKNSPDIREIAYLATAFEHMTGMTTEWSESTADGAWLHAATLRNSVEMQNVMHGLSGLKDKVEEGCFNFTDEKAGKELIVKFENGEWREAPRMPYDGLVDAFRCYVENDLEAAEPDYVRDVLESTCGLCIWELESIGLGYLKTEDEEDT